MIKIGVKPQDKEVDKGFSIVEKELDKKQSSFKDFKRALDVDDLVDSEFALAKVPALSESPTSPSSDRLRLYYRNEGKLFKLEFTEI